MAESLAVNSPAFWEEIYQGGRAGWDLGGPTPAFRRLLESGEFPPGRLIVLGAGRGHDAREFARHDFDVTAVDFASDAVQAMRALDDPNSPVAVVQGDIFELPQELNGAFDYTLEYTCFCAIDPERRPEYADVVTRLLKENGIYLNLAFPLDSHKGGPPFAVSVPEILRLFGERGFRLLQRGKPAESVPSRLGMEELLIFQKGRSLRASTQ